MTLDLSSVGGVLPWLVAGGLVLALVWTRAGRPVDRSHRRILWALRGCVVFNSHSTDHGRGERSYIGLADLFGVYFPPDDKVFLVPVGAVSPFEGCLRLEPTRNNQRKRIRFAAEFEIERWSEEKLRALTA